MVRMLGQGIENAIQVLPPAVQRKAWRGFIAERPQHGVALFQPTQVKRTQAMQRLKTGQYALL